MVSDSTKPLSFFFLVIQRQTEFLHWILYRDLWNGGKDSPSVPVLIPGLKKKWKHRNFITETFYICIGALGLALSTRGFLLYRGYLSPAVGVPSEGISICTSHLGLVSQRTENQPMQFPQTACDAAQGDDSVWSHEPDCIDTAPDERLASTLQRLGQKNATQRDLHRLERRPRANLIQFSKTKCKVLPWAREILRIPQTGSWMNWEGLVDIRQKLDVVWQCVLTSQRAKHILVCIKIIMASRSGRWFCPYNSPLLKKGWESWCSSAWEKEGLGTAPWSLSINRGLTRKIERDTYWASTKRTRLLALN